MKESLITPVVISFLTLAFGTAAPVRPADAPTAFAEIMDHYEDVRQALSYDTIDGVAENARAIHAVGQSLESSFSAAAAGVAADHGERTRELLPEIVGAASDLAAAADLGAARDAFYALSKPLVRYRFGVEGERPMVLYCPMAKRSWLQPEGEIGNPYHGRSMPTCGEIVER